MFEDVAESNREFVAQQHPIEVEAFAIPAITVGSRLDLRGVPGDIGGGGHQIDGAGGVAEAEDVGVGTAADFDGIDPDGVNGHAPHRLDVVQRDVGRGDAADADFSMFLDKMYFVTSFIPGCPFASLASRGKISNVFLPKRDLQFSSVFHDLIKSFVKRRRHPTAIFETA